MLLLIETYYTKSLICYASHYLSDMCDYMYYEHKQRGKLKNLVPTEEPELEKVEEQPMTVKA